MKHPFWPALLLTGLIFISGCSAKQTETLLPDPESPAPQQTASAVPASTEIPAEKTALPEVTEEPQADIALPFSQYGKWGLIRPDGEVILPFEYDQIYSTKTPGLYVLSQFVLTDEPWNSERYAVINSEGQILTDWTSRYPASVKDALLFRSEDGNGLVMAPVTGDVIHSLSGLGDDADAYLCGNVLMLTDDRVPSIDLIPLSSLKEGRTESVQHWAFPANNVFLEQVEDKFLFTYYGEGDSDRKTWLLDWNGQVICEHPLISAATESNTMWIQSKEYLTYSDNGMSWGLLSLSDGKVVMEAGYWGILAVKDDLVLLRQENDTLLYSLSLDRNIAQGNWQSVLLSKDGVAYGCIDYKDWYEITASGTRFIASYSDSINAYVLGDRLYIQSYDDIAVLHVFDRDTLQPVQPDKEYGSMNSVRDENSGRLYYLFWQTKWRVWDLADENGNILVSAIKRLESINDPYAILEQGFSKGIFNLKTGTWTYKTGAFSELNDY